MLILQTGVAAVTPPLQQSLIARTLEIHFPPLANHVGVRETLTGHFVFERIDMECGLLDMRLVVSVAVVIVSLPSRLPPILGINRESIGNNIISIILRDFRANHCKTN